MNAFNLSLHVSLHQLSFITAVEFLERCAFPFPFHHLLCYDEIFAVFPKVSEVVT